MKTSIPVLMVGAPGVGKTAVVESEYEYVEKVLVSTLTEEDISGLPYRKGEYDYRTVPALFRRLNDAAQTGKSTCLFLDELDKARRSVADTLLTLVCSRKVGVAALPSTTDIIAAANPPEFGGGDGISPAMLSRFSVVNYIPNPEQWANWAEEQFSSLGAKSVISAARSGEFPLLDVAGEGLQQRITCPRTITYALQVMEEGKDAENRIKGLLTSASASQMIILWQKIENDVYQRVSRIKRSSVKTTQNSVLRLP